MAAWLGLYVGAGPRLKAQHPGSHVQCAVQRSAGCYVHQRSLSSTPPQTLPAMAWCTPRSPACSPSGRICQSLNGSSRGRLSSIGTSVALPPALLSLEGARRSAPPILPEAVPAVLPALRLKDASVSGDGRGDGWRAAISTAGVGGGGCRGCRGGAGVRAQRGGCLSCPR